MDNITKLLSIKSQLKELEEFIKEAEAEIEKTKNENHDFYEEFPDTDVSYAAAYGQAKAYLELIEHRVESITNLFP